MAECITVLKVAKHERVLFSFTPVPQAALRPKARLTFLKADAHPDRVSIVLSNRQASFNREKTRVFLSTLRFHCPRNHSVAPASLDKHCLAVPRQTQQAKRIFVFRAGLFVSKTFRNKGKRAMSTLCFCSSIKTSTKEIACLGTHSIRKIHGFVVKLIGKDISHQTGMISGIARVNLAGVRGGHRLAEKHRSEEANTNCYSTITVAVSLSALRQSQQIWSSCSTLRQGFERAINVKDTDHIYCG